MSLAQLPQLGSKPVALSVRLPALKHENRLTPGLRELYAKGEFTDVTLVCAGQSFSAHKLVLGAQSPVFKQGLISCPTQETQGQALRQEVRLAEVSNPEAVKFMLDYMYELDPAVWEDYKPGTQEINRDVLQLAQSFQLPGLRDRAKQWLAKDLTTANVVERLSICDAFDLEDLREKILMQLTTNQKALADVVHSPQIMKYPALMQSLLQMSSALQAEDQPKKRARKA